MSNLLQRSGYSGSNRALAGLTSVLKTLGVLLVCVSTTMAMMSPALGIAIDSHSAHGQQDVIEIESWNDLAGIGTKKGPIDGHYVLVTDLDADSPGYGGNGEDGVVLDSEGNPENGTGFDPILPASGFAGTFDGQGHEIADLVAQQANGQLIGLFGALAETGEVRNLTVGHVDLSAKTKVGAIAGKNNGGTIANTCVTGTVSGQSNIGGIVGVNANGRISHSNVKVDVNGSGTVGGVAGANIQRATIKHVETHASVTGSGLHVGGIVGKNEDSRILNVSVDGNVTAADLALYMGGIAGTNSGMISDSSSAVNVATEFNAAGGIAGKNSGRVTNSTASGDVNGSNIIGGAVGTNNDRGLVFQSAATGDVKASGRNVGGLIGANHAKVTRSYAHGDVVGDINVGGLVGVNRGSFSSVANISASYAAGPVDGRDNVSGLVGWTESSTGVIDSYWNAEVTGIRTSKSLPDRNGLSSAAMQGLDVPTNLTAFKFDSVWEPTDGYPVLQFQWNEKQDQSRFDDSPQHRNADNDGPCKHTDGQGNLTVADVVLIFGHSADPFVENNSAVFASWHYTSKRVETSALRRGGCHSPASGRVSTLPSA